MNLYKYTISFNGVEHFIIAKDINSALTRAQEKEEDLLGVTAIKLIEEDVN